MTQSDRLIVNFHGIGEPGSQIPDDERPYWCSTDEWTGIADELAALAATPKSLPEITFDDGNLSDITHALPMLAERGLKATFFVCAGRIGSPLYLGKDDLSALVDAGMAIGSHGWDHRDLRLVDDAGLRRETVDARRSIQDASSAPVEDFALPFGSYDRRVLKSLRQYRRVLSSDGARVTSTRHPVPRFSYVKGWRPGYITHLATTKPLLLRRLRSAAATTIKSWR